MNAGVNQDKMQTKITILLFNFTEKILLCLNNSNNGMRKKDKNARYIIYNIGTQHSLKKV